MGCSISSQRHSKRLRSFKSHSLSVTPGTFIKLSSRALYTDYTEIQKLGSGAFAEVMLCLHKQTNTKRAVKIINKSGIDYSLKDPVYKLKEIKILKTLDHPHVLKCFEIFEDDRYYYVSTEYCPAGDLFSEIVKLSRFKESQAAEIMLQLFSAVSYCHSKKVIHRDLKPENILLMEKGESLCLTVADFGSSSILDPNATLSGCYGSAYYLAPEVFSNRYDEKCDIWSLGIIMYILLTGRPPYRGKGSDQIISQIQVSPFVLTSELARGLSEEATDLISRLLALKPKNRISAKNALKHPWITKHRLNKNNDTQILLNNLRAFNCNSKLKEAVHIFIASQIVNHKDSKYIKECFMKIDKDGDGKITKEELITEYSKYMSMKEAEKVAGTVIEKLDQDCDGNIDYTEFLISCLEKQKNLSIDNLLAAFKMFDLDGSGTITSDEIKAVLDNGEEIDESIWKVLLKEGDKNGDGCVDLREFLSLMSMKKSMISN